MRRFLVGTYKYDNMQGDLANLPNSDPNLVSTSFDPQISFIPGGESAVWDVPPFQFSKPLDGGERRLLSGFWGAQQNDLAKFYTILHFLYELYLDLKKDVKKLTDNVVQLVFILKTVIENYWEALNDLNKINALLIPEVNADKFTEIFRRLSGFKTMVDGLLVDRRNASGDYLKLLAQRQQSRPVTDRLLCHLNCNMNYYIQQFLGYLYDKTNNQAIVDFVNEIINSLDRVNPNSPASKVLHQYFDVERAFIDKQQIVVPAFCLWQFENQQIKIPSLDFSKMETIKMDQINPIVDNEVYVPLNDGVHLEAVAGKCVLSDVPPAPPAKLIQLTKVVKESISSQQGQESGQAPKQSA